MHDRCGASTSKEKARASMSIIFIQASKLVLEAYHEAVLVLVTARIFRDLDRRDPDRLDGEIEL